MIFIHHHNDTEREQQPPEAIRSVARRTCERAGPTATSGTRIFVPTHKPQMSEVRTTPPDAANYWEIVIETTDL
jgi:hypothetical protein